MTEKKLDKRRKYYLILDCETATLPIAESFSADDRKKVAIAKPLIYDLGWQVADREGRVYRRKNFLISEIFSVPSIFNTAYYAAKRPIYIEKLNKGLITLTDWKTATAELEKDMEEVEAVGAYNSMFDFKKAIPFTELYINNLYSDNFYKWENYQNQICREIVAGKKASNKNFDGENFRFRGKSYKLFDLWGLSCRHLLNNDDYKKMCIQNNWVTDSKKYYKTSAETAFRFCENIADFEESHTAIEDAEIETKLFAKITKKTKHKFEIGIIFFPFRELGVISLEE